MRRLKTIFLSLYLWGAIALVFLLFFPVAVLLALLYPVDPARRLLHWAGLRVGRLIVALHPLWHVSFEGEARIPRGRPFVYVCNHESHADSVALTVLDRQFKWVLKESLTKIPVFGWILRLAGYISVRRGERESARGAMEEARRWIERGIGVFFFPEGTRSANGALGPFKDGAFRLALETQTPVVPLVIVGSRDALPKHSIWFTSQAHIRIWAGAPLSVEGEATPEAVSALRDRVRAVIEAQRARLGADSPNE